MTIYVWEPIILQELVFRKYADLNTFGRALFKTSALKSDSLPDEIYLDFS
jgi:hypothetical protein